MPCHSESHLCNRIISGAIGVGGTLLGLVPYLTRGEVRARRLQPPRRLQLPRRCFVRRTLCQLFFPALCDSPPLLARASNLTLKRNDRNPCPFATQRKRVIGDRFTEAMYDRDAAIKKQFG